MEPVRGGGGDRSGPREGEGRGRYGRASEEADGERYSVWHGAWNGTRDRFRERERDGEQRRREERGARLDRRGSVVRGEGMAQGKVR